MTKDELAKHSRPGKNSKVYLSVVNASGQRGRDGCVSMRTLAGVTADLLPTRVVYENDTSSECPHFYATDASQTACKKMQMLQLVLTAGTGGHERKDAAKVELKRPIFFRNSGLRVLFTQLNSI